MERDGDVDAEVLSLLNSPSDSGHKLDGYKVGTLTGLRHRPILAGTQEVLILNVYESLSPAYVVDIRLLDGVVIDTPLAALKVVDLALCVKNGRSIRKQNYEN